ncbi:MAG: tadA 2, partial [Aeromicrobium sp.]|nr:tadA 2 [Aeromicrobium sp.]
MTELPRYGELMREALALAVTAADSDDVPVGAVVVDATGVVIGRGRNIREAEGDPTGHAEIVAIREAAADRGEWRLEGCVGVQPVLDDVADGQQPYLQRLVRRRADHVDVERDD